MTWEEAFKAMAQKYWDEEQQSDTPSAMDKVKPMKYNKKYFDNFASENGIGVPKKEAGKKPTPKKDPNAKDTLPPNKMAPKANT